MAPVSTVIDFADRIEKSAVQDQCQDFGQISDVDQAKPGARHHGARCEAAFGQPEICKGFSIAWSIDGRRPNGASRVGRRGGRPS